MMDIAPRLEIVDLAEEAEKPCVQECYFVKKNPETGGVTNPPKPHPMKKMEESRPVMFLFLATQEKAEPNYWEKSHHNHHHHNDPDLPGDEEAEGGGAEVETGDRPAGRHAEEDRGGEAGGQRGQDHVPAQHQIYDASV